MDKPMGFYVLTLFPEMIQKGCDNSILKRAMAQDHIRIQAINIRDYSGNRHGKVDDYTYGGGAGMLMQAQPVYDAWRDVVDHISQEKTDISEPSAKRVRTIYVTPKGEPFTQKMAKELAKEEELIFLCGHYEGIDERVLEEIVTDRVSIGDYVLTGGELPAMVMIDAISRLVPGVLGSEESAETETFENELLEYPQYSRPEVWHGKAVPEVLLSGDHKRIEEWRRIEAERLTEKVRPDLFERYCRRQKVISALMRHKKENAYMIDSLMRDMADILYADENVVAAVHRVTRVVMLCLDSPEEFEKLQPFLPEDCHLILHNCEALAPILEEKLGMKAGDACYQSVYTQKNSLSVAYKNIGLFPASKLDYAVENYGGESEREYLKDRIGNKELFAAFEGDRIIGFAGSHAGGSLGILYVDPEYRRSNVGSSLACYLVNLALDRGGLPYAHIRVSNEASLKMQEKMGLYLGKKKIFWMYKKEN